LAYVVYEEHGEDDVNAADAALAGCVHPFITGCQMLLMQVGDQRRLWRSVRLRTFSNL